MLALYKHVFIIDLVQRLSARAPWKKVRNSLSIKRERIHGSTNRSDPVAGNGTRGRYVVRARKSTRRRKTRNETSSPIHSLDPPEPVPGDSGAMEYRRNFSIPPLHPSLDFRRCFRAHFSTSKFSLRMWARVARRPPTRLGHDFSSNLAQRRHANASAPGGRSTSLVPSPRRNAGRRGAHAPTDASIRHDLYLSTLNERRLPRTSISTDARRSRRMSVSGMIYRPEGAG